MPDAMRQELFVGLSGRVGRAGCGESMFLGAARAFLARWPDPQAWAEQPLPVRLSAGSAVRPLLTYLMLAGYLRPGYDYLLERKLSAILREAKASPWRGCDPIPFRATELGYSPQIAAGLASQVAVRMLIQTGRPLSELGDTDIAEFTAAITAREQAHGRQLQHYRTALYATRAVLYHLGGQVTPTAKNTAHLRWPWRRHFAGVPTGSAIRWLPTWNARRVPAPDRPCWASPAASGISPGSSPPTIRADLPGRPGPATPHRALSGRRGRRPQPAHRRDPVGLRAALAGADRWAADR